LDILCQPMIQHSTDDGLAGRVSPWSGYIYPLGRNFGEVTADDLERKLESGCIGFSPDLCNSCQGGTMWSRCPSKKKTVCSILFSSTCSKSYSGSGGGFDRVPQNVGPHWHAFISQQQIRASRHRSRLGNHCG